MEPLSLLGLEFVKLEEGTLMKVPTLLRIDCWQTSKAVWIRPYPLSVFTPSLTNPEAAEWRLLTLESQSCTCSRLLA